MPLWVSVGVFFVQLCTNDLPSTAVVLWWFNAKQTWNFAEIGCTSTVICAHLALVLLTFEAKVSFSLVQIFGKLQCFGFSYEFLT